MRARRILAPVAVAIALLAGAAPAQATFHLIKVREVYAGGSGNTSYVELQMYAANQNLLATHSMTLYDASGALAHTSTFPSSVANGANQATVLIGGGGVQGAFGVAPDLVDEGLHVPAGGGAACWNASGIPADCVAWGNFNGGAALQSATGTTAGNPVSPVGIAAGKAIRRTIAPSCPTMLEEADDSNDSATDFEEVTPAPRDNASAIPEAPCTGPTVAVDSGPANPTSSTAASFTYHASAAEATFECRLDAAAFTPCEASGKAYPGPLGEGGHTFQVHAHNSSGTGPTASYAWTIDTTPPVADITAHPADPGPGNSAAFAYVSNEAGSTFECSLAPAGEPAAFTGCPLGGKSYPDAEHPAPLANGDWVFEVRATDKAGNRSSPEPFPAGTFTWRVDNSLADTTPPDTTIVSKPPDPSDSADVTFTYASNEAGSTFECSLDGAPFVACPVGGITYSGVPNGSHTFQVRAIDASSNVDPTPAGYTFDVVALRIPLPPPPAEAGLVRPNTTVVARPPPKTRDRTPTLRFRSSVAGARFQCALDRSRFRPCTSPLTLRPLTLGAHAIRVRAVAAGLPDPTPVVVRFTVVRGGGHR